jgi:DNA-binding cell septation regulator SpoVG
MKIIIDRFETRFLPDGKEVKSFNLQLANGAEPFLTVFGCKLMSGSKGPWVSFPARKSDDGKWWNHCKASEAFQAAILAEIDKMPKTVAEKRSADSWKGKSLADAPDDVPW